MKRPQFSIRLMLLLVALAATIFGWRAAVEQAHRENRSGKRFTWQLFIRDLEKHRAEQEERLHNENSLIRDEAAERLKGINERIAETKELLDKIEK